MMMGAQKLILPSVTRESQRYGEQPVTRYLVDGHCWAERTQHGIHADCDHTLTAGEAVRLSAALLEAVKDRMAMSLDEQS